MNITDVGHIVGDVDEGADRMQVAAEREHRDPLEIAAAHTDEFVRDARLVGLLAPHVMPRATDHIPEMISLIERLLARGHAYAAADGVYFDVSSWPAYGKLSRRDLGDLLVGARVEPNANKRNGVDFALWRRAKPRDLQVWESPWGPGNPGWHIECSAMSMKYLGEIFALHSGGEDHIFPHHECEIAQSEAATGRSFARLWLHVRFLRVDGRAMHKSIGNVITLSDVMARGFQPMAFRLLALQANYRTPLNFTWMGLEHQERRLQRWQRTIGADALSSQGVGRAPAAIVSALESDLNTARALAGLDELLATLSQSAPGARAQLVQKITAVGDLLGLDLRGGAVLGAVLSDAEQQAITDRAQARARGDWVAADKIRETLRQQGLVISDLPGGQQQAHRVGELGPTPIERLRH